MAEKQNKEKEAKGDVERLCQQHDAIKIEITGMKAAVEKKVCLAARSVLSSTLELSHRY